MPNTFGRARGPWRPSTAFNSSPRPTEPAATNALFRLPLKAPSFPIPWMQAYQPPNLLINIAPTPVINKDWQLPRAPAPYIVSQQPAPMALMTSQPFVQADFSLPRAPAQFVVSQQPTPFTLQNVRPFVQTDFSLPAKPPGFVVSQQPSLVAIQASIPFHNISELTPRPLRNAFQTWSTNLLETTLKSRQVIWTPTGGFVIGGHPLVIRKKHYNAAGGITISGAATVIEVPVGGGGTLDGVSAPGFKTNLGLNKTKNWG